MHKRTLGYTIAESPSSRSHARERKVGFSNFHPEPERDGLVGRMVGGRYSILEKLGEGGAGEVYGAIDCRTNSRVAVKIAVERCRRANGFMDNEAKALSRVRDARVVSISGSGVHEGRNFIVLEYLGGKSLDAILESGDWVPFRTIRSVLIQACDALAAVHDAGMIHRDVKPANVFVLEDGSVKLIDFGIAEDGERKPETEPGLIIGTPAYVAPETVFSRAYDERVDVYAFGGMMYRIVCGTAPFTGNPGEVVLSHINDDPVPPREMRPWLGIPEALERIIMKALRKNPDERHRGMRELRDEIAALPEWSASIPPGEVGPRADGEAKTRDFLHPAAAPLGL
ncbi:MAG: serine/threonine-protein kinase [Candidatus Micrarchaeota archaeon]